MAARCSAVCLRPFGQPAFRFALMPRPHSVSMRETIAAPWLSDSLGSGGGPEVGAQVASADFPVRRRFDRQRQFSPDRLRFRAEVVNAWLGQANGRAELFLTAGKPYGPLNMGAKVGHRLSIGWPMPAVNRPKIGRPIKKWDRFGYGYWRHDPGAAIVARNERN